MLGKFQNCWFKKLDSVRSQDWALMNKHRVDFFCNWGLKAEALALANPMIYTETTVALKERVILMVRSR